MLLSHLASSLLSPATKLCKVRVSSVCLLPGQDSLEAEEDNNPKLEDILDLVHLVILISMPGHQLCWAVGQQLILLDHNITKGLHRAKVTKFH